MAGSDRVRLRCEFQKRGEVVNYARRVTGIPIGTLPIILGAACQTAERATGIAAMDEDSRREIIEQLKPALALASNARANLTDLTEGSTIIEDVGLASLDLLELRFELENQWQIQISDEQAIGLRTIGDIVDLIAQSTHRRDGHL